jgi:hypothetical protein
MNTNETYTTILISLNIDYLYAQISFPEFKSPQINFPFRQMWSDKYNMYPVISLVKCELSNKCQTHEVWWLTNHLKLFERKYNVLY